MLVRAAPKPALLLTLYLDAGVLGGCSDLCGLLPNQVEATVCDLVCAVVGIEGFIDLVEGAFRILSSAQTAQLTFVVVDADPDPIWICEEVDVCPINDKV